MSHEQHVLTNLCSSAVSHTSNNCAAEANCGLYCCDHVEWNGVNCRGMISSMRTGWKELHCRPGQASEACVHCGT